MAVVKVTMAYHVCIGVRYGNGHTDIIQSDKSARVRLLFYTVVKLVLGVSRGCFWFWKCRINNIVYNVNYSNLIWYCKSIFKRPSLWHAPFAVSLIRFELIQYNVLNKKITMWHDTINMLTRTYFMPTKL